MPIPRQEDRFPKTTGLSVHPLGTSPVPDLFLWGSSPSAAGSGEIKGPGLEIKKRVQLPAVGGGLRPSLLPGGNTKSEHPSCRLHTCCVAFEVLPPLCALSSSSVKWDNPIFLQGFSENLRRRYNKPLVQCSA